MENDNQSLLTTVATFLGERRAKNEVFTEAESLLEGLFFQQVLIFECLNSSKELRDAATAALEKLTAQTQ